MGVFILRHGYPLLYSLDSHPHINMCFAFGVEMCRPTANRVTGSRLARSLPCRIISSGCSGLCERPRSQSPKKQGYLLVVSKMRTFAVVLKMPTMLLCCFSIASASKHKLMRI